MITISSPSSRASRNSKSKPVSKSGPVPNKRCAARINRAFEKTRKELRSLSNTKLLSNLENLDKRERRLKAFILLYLSEIESRELYLPLGFSSLFEFCTGQLGYTRATACRRIRSARAAARYPEALEMLCSGEINITTLSIISEILDPDNHGELLEGIKHRSVRYVETLVSRHRPVPLIRDSVRPVCVRRRVQESRACGGSSAGTEIAIGASTAQAETKAVAGPGQPGSVSSAGTNSAPGTVPGRSDFSSSAETKNAAGAVPTHPAPGSRSGANSCNTNTQEAAELINNNSKTSLSAETKLSASGHPTRIVLEQRLKLGFTVSPAFMQKYDKIKSLLSGTYPEGMSFETLFEILMDEYLETHDPERRHSRRGSGAGKSCRIKGRGQQARSRSQSGGAAKRKNNSKGAASSVSGGKGGNAINKSGRSRDNSRRIPPAVRDRVYARDNGRCTYVGANGKRCSSTWDLEIDHIIPYARGGDNSPGNLRLLCRKHNIQQAERAYGREFMKNRIKRE